MKEGLDQLGFNSGKTETPIIPVKTGDLATTFNAIIKLQEEGVLVNPVMPPAVPEEIVFSG
jgi:8-amino-7-oxononanoate synthase